VQPRRLLQLHAHQAHREVSMNALAPHMQCYGTRLMTSRQRQSDLALLQADVQICKQLCRFALLQADAGTCHAAQLVPTCTVHMSRGSWVHVGLSLCVFGPA
jgi:hypothetical protein